MAQFSISIPTALPNNVTDGKVAIYRVLDGEVFDKVRVGELPSRAVKWARAGMDTHRLIVLQKGTSDGEETITHRWNPVKAEWDNAPVDSAY